MKLTFKEQEQLCIAKRISNYGSDITAEEFNADPIKKAQLLRLHRKKQDSKKKGICFDLKYPDLDWPEYCPVLGLKLNYQADSREESSPSFDRVNSDLGYIKENVRIISWRANRIKNDGTEEEHRKIADYIALALYIPACTLP